MGAATLTQVPVLSGVWEKISGQPVRKTEECVTDPSQFSDETLARLLQSGRMDLAEELVRRYAPRLLRVICRIVRHDVSAEDILQDTWFNVVRKIHLYDASRPLAPWLVRIAVNCCRDHWRKDRWRRFWHRATSSGEQSDPVEALASKETDGLDSGMDISAALAALSHRHREVVALKFYSGLTHDEIAQVLNIPSGTVKSRLHIALNHLREYFEKGGQHEAAR
jgi:RNA polymerase sigma-70 factor, ECF subfamily